MEPPWLYLGTSLATAAKILVKDPTRPCQLVKNCQCGFWGYSAATMWTKQGPYNCVPCILHPQTRTASHPRSQMLITQPPEELGKRFHRAVCRVNADFNMCGLCMQFPDRLFMLVSTTHGDRLPR